MTSEHAHDGRRALVTGAGQGVGRAIALELAREGAEVVVNDLDPGRAGTVATEITALGGKAVAAPFDVTDWAAVREAAGGTGPIDILVNNAGNAGRISAMGTADLVPFVETEPAEWAGFLGVNLYGVMHATRAFLPAMIEGSWGRVVTVVSDAGRIGEPALAAYSAAKAGAAGFSRAVAREVGRHGVTVNCVSLGTIGAENAPADDPAPSRVLGRYVIRRTGRPDEAAALVSFLSGPRAGWVTGQTYPVNGGYSFTL